MATRKTLVSNIFSIGGMQFANYLLPLLTVPYITRIIGPDNYGLINFAYSFVNYFLLFVNFSFDLSATREVSLNRDDKTKLNEIFSSVISARIILFAISTAAFLPVIFLVPKFNNDLILYIFSYLVIFGNVFFPVWLFQGMEKLTRLAVFNLLFKIFYTISIFIFINDIDDYILIPFIASLVQVILGLGAFTYAIKLFKVKIISPQFDNIIYQFKEGWKIFISSISVNLYTSTNVVILGILAANIYVGYYTAVMKLISVVQGLILFPINLSFFPHVGSLIKDSREAGINSLKKLTFIVGGLTLIASVVLFVFAELIIRIIFGSEFVEAALCLRIAAFLPFIIGLSNVFALNGLLNLKMDKAFLIITSAGAVISIVLNLILVPRFLENGTATAWLITEVFITAASYVVLLKNGINLFDWKYFKTFISEGGKNKFRV